MLNFKEFFKNKRRTFDDNIPNVSNLNPQNAEEIPPGSNPSEIHGWRNKKLFAFLAIILIVVVSISTFLTFNKIKTAKFHNVAQKFELKESSPSDQDDAFSTIGQPTFVFSKKIGIPENDLNKYFEISPSVSGTWHLEENGQVVYLSSDKTQADGFTNNLSYNTVYKVTVNKNLHSTDGQELPNDINVEFRTKLDPLFNLQTNQKLISTVPGQPLSIELDSPSNDTNSTNINVGIPLTITIQPATQNQLLEYFSYKGDKEPLYKFLPNSSSDARQLQLLLQSGESTNTYQVQLEKDSFPSPGLYFVKLKNNYGSEDLFVVASNHINQVFNDAKNTYVWATEQDAGKSVSDITAELYRTKDKPELLDKVVTGNDGIAKSEHSADDVDFVITRRNNDTAITFTKTYGYYGYYGSTNNGEDKYQVFSYSDRPVYRPGDTVHYKAVIRKKEKGEFTIPKGTYYTKLVLDYGSPNPDDDYKSVEIDENGTVTLNIQLPQMTAGYYPQITLSSKNNDNSYRQIDSLPIVVQSYRKPDMDITATSQEKEYISSDMAHFTVFAKTNFGQPLTNLDFSYRVLISDFSEVKDRTTEDIGSVVTGYYGSGDELASGNGRFDDKGIAQITFPTTLDSKYEPSQIATLEVTPNIGASPSIGKIARLIHRGEFALFIDDLSGDINEGITGKISVLNHNIPRQAVGDQPIIVSLYKVIDYNNKQLMQSQNVTSGADSTANFSFQKVDIGNYEVVAQAIDSRSDTVTIRQQVYVGQSRQYTSNQPQFNLDIKSQKNTYKVNDTANLPVSANFLVDDAIVIITNNDGNSSNIVSLSRNYIGNNSWNLPVQIKDEFGQEVGVDIFTVNKSNVVGGHTNININKGERKINTTITFDKEIYSPGDTVKTTITTKDQQGNPISADNSLSVIDASILQIGQLNGNIFDSFYSSFSYSAVAHYDSTTGILRDTGGGGGGCFLKGTQILMADGTTKNIEDIQIGDKILTRASAVSSQLVMDTVTNTNRHAVTDYLTINENLNVTWIHRIYINNGWYEAKDAKIGDTLLDNHGNFVTITSITPHLGQFSVYNLTTANYHTFFANGYYVHNEKGLGPRQNFADTAHWDPHIETNANGQATVSFKLPDNVTTFTSQVISNSKDSQFGQITSSLISQKDFNIIPAIANFYYQGDKPLISALIQNSSQQDIDANVNLTVKELDFSKNQVVHINKNDFGIFTMPVDLGTKADNLSFLIETKNSGGNLLDSILVKKPILPKGNITSSWLSFQGSKNISFDATYPSLDFNIVNLSVVPNIISKLFHSNIYFNQGPSVSAGQDLYSYSYILAKTRDGEISPTSYSYATVKNEFRNTVENLMKNKTGNHWNLPSYSTEASLVAMNLWIAHGLDQAASVHMLDEINNISSVISNTKQYIKSYRQGATTDQIAQLILESQQENNYYNNSREEQLARQWVLNEQTSQNTPEALAISALNGSQSALGQLKSLSLTSANDRLIWDGDTQYSDILPALAMIEKGSQEDADKAIKGLSFKHTDDSYMPLVLLAGAQYASRNNLYVDEPSIKVIVNDQVVYSTKQEQKYNLFTKSLLAKNSKDGKIAINIEANGDVPVYSTVVQTDFNNKTSNSGNTTSKFAFNRIKDLFGANNAQTTGEAKVIDINLKRVYKNIQTGESVSEIKQGEAGVVALTGNADFAKYLASDRYYSSQYAFMLEDAISPSYLYLNQTLEFSSSPQYQSTISRIFPGNNIYYGSTIPPNDYSDETVFFNSILFQANIVLPYVVFNVSGGTYYQPKTSIVFPVLGLIANEE